MYEPLQKNQIQEYFQTMLPNACQIIWKKTTELRTHNKVQRTTYELDRYERDSGFRRTQPTRPAAPKEEPRPSEPEVADTPKSRDELGPRQSREGSEPEHSEQIWDNVGP